MKKENKILLIIVLILLAAHFMCVIDFKMVDNFQIPLLCIEINSLEDDDIGKYIGLGYSFVVERTHFSSTAIHSKTPDLTYYSMRILGIPISEARASTNQSVFHGEVIKIEEPEDKDGSVILLLQLDYDKNQTRKILIPSEIDISNHTHNEAVDIKVGDKITAQVEYYDVFREDAEEFIYPAYNAVIKE